MSDPYNTKRDRDAADAAAMPPPLPRPKKARAEGNQSNMKTLTVSEGQTAEFGICEVNLTVQELMDADPDEAECPGHGDLPPPSSNEARTYETVEPDQIPFVVDTSDCEVRKMWIMNYNPNNTISDQIVVKDIKKNPEDADAAAMPPPPAKSKRWNIGDIGCFLRCNYLNIAQITRMDECTEFDDDGDEAIATKYTVKAYDGTCWYNTVVNVLETTERVSKAMIQLQDTISKIEANNEAVPTEYNAHFDRFKRMLAVIRLAKGQCTE